MAQRRKTTHQFQSLKLWEKRFIPYGPHSVLDSARYHQPLPFLRLEQWPLTLEIHSAEALAVSEKLWSFGMHFEDRMAPEMFVYFQMQTQDLATSVEDDDTVSADDWRSPADRLMDRNIR